MVNTGPREAREKPRRSHNGSTHEPRKPDGTVTQIDLAGQKTAPQIRCTLDRLSTPRAAFIDPTVMLAASGTQSPRLQSRSAAHERLHLTPTHNCTGFADNVEPCPQLGAMTSLLVELRKCRGATRTRPPPMEHLPAEPIVRRNRSMYDRGVVWKTRCDARAHVVRQETEQLRAATEVVATPPSRKTTQAEWNSFLLRSDAWWQHKQGGAYTRDELALPCADIDGRRFFASAVVTDDEAARARRRIEATL
jgi:hypothetical protein